MLNKFYTIVSRCLIAFLNRIIVVNSKNRCFEKLI